MSVMLRNEASPVAEIGDASFLNMTNKDGLKTTSFYGSSKI